MFCLFTLYAENRADDSQPDQRILYVYAMINIFFMINNQNHYEPCWSASALHDTKALMAG